MGASGQPAAEANARQSQGVGGVVPTANAQGIGMNGAGYAVLLPLVAAALAGFVGIHARAPARHAVDDFNAEIARPPRHVGTKGDVGALLLGF